MMQKLNANIIGPEGEIYKCWNDVNSPNKVVGNILTLDKEPSHLFYNYINCSLNIIIVFIQIIYTCTIYKLFSISYMLCNVYGTLTDLEDALLTSLDISSNNKMNLRL